MNEFKELLLESLDLSFYGNNLVYLFFLFVLILVSILFNSFIASFIVNKIKKIVKKTSNQIDDNLFKTLLPPSRILPIVIVFFLISLNFYKKTNIGFYLLKINKKSIFLFVYSS